MPEEHKINDDGTYIYIYRVSRETSPTAHRKVDGIEINIKVFYRLAISIIEILMFNL